MGKHQLIGKWGESSNQEYQAPIADGTIRLDLRDQSAGALVTVYTTSLPALVGAWHHLAVTYDGRGGATAADGITMYVDGVVVPLFRIHESGVCGDGTAGRPGRDRPGGGVLESVPTVGSTRSASGMSRAPQSQIQAARAEELTGAEPGLVAYWRFNEASGPTSVDDSPANHIATLSGAARVEGGPLAPDVTAPDITNIVTSNVTTTGATISFTTSEPATGWVSYSATGACPCIDVFSAAIGTSHIIALAGLAPDTTYTFTATATDAATNVRTSAAMTFHTLAPPSDPQPPTVSLTSPAAGTVAGMVTIDATASDNVGVVERRVPRGRRGDRTGRRAGPVFRSLG